mgnify:CR=1 FL=1
MTETLFEVLAIGNAIVDVVAPCDDTLIAEYDMPRGGMTLIDDRDDVLRQLCAKHLVGDVHVERQRHIVEMKDRQRIAVCRVLLQRLVGDGRLAEQKFEKRIVCID